MEHRLGARLQISIPVRCEPTNRGAGSVGVLTNVSLSGGFVADLDLRLLSRVQISLDLPAQSLESIVSAYVVRRSGAGSGLEWCEWAPAPITQLLRSMSRSRPSGWDRG
jgi:hypothetical protein